MVQAIFSKLVLNLILIILSPIIVVVFLPIYSFRYFVAKVIVRFYPDIAKLLTTRSSCSGAEPINVLPRSTLVCVYIANGTVALEHFRHLFQTRVLDFKRENGQLQKPELQQYVTKFWGFLAWKWETQFDITTHIRMYDGKFACGVKLVNSEIMARITEELVYQGFPKGKSPWEIFLVHNYQENSTSPISTAIVTKIHHSIGDGFTILKTLNELTQSKSSFDVAGVSVKSSRISGLWKNMKTLFSAPFDFLMETRNAMDVNSWHIPENRLKLTVNGCMSPPISMKYLQEVKTWNEASLSELIFACFTGAIRRFMMEAGFEVPTEIHCVTPLPYPGHPDKMRNHHTGCFLSLPVGMSDSGKRLANIQQNWKRVRKSSFPWIMFQMISVGGGLFSCLIPSFTENKRTTVVISSVPGPSKTSISLDNHELVSMWFGGGLNGGNCGIGFTSMSYNGNIRFVIGIDEGLVSRDRLPAKKFIDYFLEELENYRKDIFV